MRCSRAGSWISTRSAPNSTAAPPAALDPATAALFPDSFQDSEAGHIPKGWTIQPVGKVVDCVGGGTPSTAEPKYWEAGTHHWTTPKDFSSLQAPVLLDTDRKLTDAGIAKISSGLLPAGTLLLSSRAPVGYLAIAAMPVAINQGFIALKCNDRASNFFMLNWCQTNMAEIESRATGTTFAEISKQNLRPIREYTDGKWDWEVVPETDVFPETLLLEVIGSRRPILFIEGDSSSLDYFIYGRVFPDLTVVPCGSCELVVHSARSFSSMHNLHHNKCYGLVDNDGPSARDIEMLDRLGIAVLPVAIIENLFLLESILRLAAQRLGHDPAETVQKIKARVFAKLGEMRVRVVSDLTRQEIETGLRLFGKGGDGSSALTAAFKNACDAIDPAVIYEKWDQEIARVLEDEDYAAALRYYKIKGLVAEAGSVFGMKYQDQLLRWLRSKDVEDLLTAFRVAIPQCAVGGQ